MGQVPVEVVPSLVLSIFYRACILNYKRGSSLQDTGNMPGILLSTWHMWSHFFPKITYEIGILPISKARHLKLQGVKWFAQGHVASEKQTWALNPVHLFHCLSSYLLYHVAPQIWGVSRSSDTWNISCVTPASCRKGGKRFKWFSDCWTLRRSDFPEWLKCNDNEVFPKAVSDCRENVGDQMSGFLSLRHFLW